MFQPASTLTVSDLQATTVALRYHGDPALKVQLVRTDESGHVLFFVVDGNLYDGEGYLIADAKAEGCTECLEIGVMEMLAIPAPGQCDKYFLFSMNTATNSSADLGLQIAILDLAGTNPHWPGHRGRLMNVYDGEQLAYPPWSNWVIGSYQDEYTSNFVGSLLGDQGMKSSTPILRAIDPTGSGELYWLYVISTLRVTQFRIDASGVQLVPTVAGDFVPTYSDQVNFGYKPRYRDASVCAAGGQVRLAMTNCGQYGWTQSGGVDADDDAILVMRFNSTTGAFISSVGIDDGTGGLPHFAACDAPTWAAPGFRGGANGIAWLAAGSKLLITGDSYENDTWSQRMGVFDMVNQLWTDLIAPLAVQDAEDYVRSRLYRNT
ncbi:MAG: hypothetical protein KA791_05435 [Flavobacteriales bacterium]|nr:hypothetical protein [Flavobacteriales bacterium]